MDVVKIPLVLTAVVLAKTNIEYNICKLKNIETIVSKIHSPVSLF